MLFVTARHLPEDTVPDCSGSWSDPISASSVSWTCTWLSRQQPGVPARHTFIFGMVPVVSDLFHLILKKRETIRNQHILLLPWKPSFPWFRPYQTHHYPSVSRISMEFFGYLLILSSWCSWKDRRAKAPTGDRSFQFRARKPGDIGCHVVPLVIKRDLRENAWW